MTKMQYSTNNRDFFKHELHKSLEISSNSLGEIPTTSRGSVQIEMADAATRYAFWSAPTVIVSDGAYGLGLFPGEPPTPTDLSDWYAPHIAAWESYSLPETTLWFWCSEIGWATVHPLLVKSGWQYRSVNVWDKGIAHIAGNVNSKTIRRFPIVTEVCAHYVRDVHLPTGDGQKLPIQQWLRHEWQRTGIPLCKTNEACGVKNAATRKYFTQDHLWYFPPPEMMERISIYANRYGVPTPSPYFSIDGKSPVTAEEWSRMRAKWNHTHGVTNVWSEAAVRGAERLKNNQAKSIHANQKPVSLIERIILASSDRSDVVWEPFGGMCSAAVASLRKGRRCYSAEINTDYYQLARGRIEKEYELCTSFLFPDFL
ncbi:MAG: site-specific DNA-methyltransferase [Gomphosphaeria aponina SAG 52.96 = DSM 107014]|uniref:Methyltransferase n=1 Tax=Gomphosphaeria aponina SAG 52.96 = DSM 107014 TaxID=1521640 RepID=A0A941GXH5_9CHRO|nr:site-specific DNA-methyltransferase [Gomphosphaeria aponina SAG 52.96 = DSM 107014]